MLRNTPLFIVIGDVQRVIPAPRAAVVNSINQNGLTMLFEQITNFAQQGFLRRRDRGFLGHFFLLAL